VDLDPRRDVTLRAQLPNRALRTQLEALTQELAELREENARLRMDATRPRSLRAVGDSLQTVADAVLEWKAADAGDRRATPADELDEAWHRLAEARQLRTTVASVLADLQVACQQLLSRLELDVGSMEIDRRARDRATSVSPRKKRATSIRSTP
jgi:uncharacterized alpha-E superfamily protein